jgi:sulfofructose kinase
MQFPEIDKGRKHHSKFRNAHHAIYSQPLNPWPAIRKPLRAIALQAYAYYVNHDCGCEIIIRRAIRSLLSPRDLGFPSTFPLENFPRPCKFQPRRLIKSLMPLEEVETADVVGVGVNATDTLIRLPHFPSFNSKMEVLSVRREAGGQVASAMVACRRWGLTARYVGTVGDDEAGGFQSQQFELAGVDARLIVVPGARSQFAYILLDEPSGERTILWGRDRALTLKPERIERAWIERSRFLHVDGHDPDAATQAARWARAAKIPVMADMDNVYPGVELLLGQTDYLLTTAEFPVRLVGESDPLKALPLLYRRFGCRVTGATLGEEGAIIWDGEQFFHAPGFVVDAVDTTGAGDIFHAGYIYAVLAGWDTARSLEFACAAAALNCTGLGARGGIRPVEEILRLVESGRRHEPAFSPETLARAGATARTS